MDFSTFSGSPLEIQIEGCKTSNLHKSVGDLREILKIEGCNSSLPQNRGVQLHPLHHSNAGAVLHPRSGHNLGLKFEPNSFAIK